MTNENKALCDHPQRKVVGHGAKTRREITWCVPCAKADLDGETGKVKAA